ncbi:MAG: hypothetical protein UU77_C0050G0004 [candidate division WWE3 bacterium GW2011_GWC1_41_7]|uniref:Uncharacterized protein n=4 Tax=Katanobacteria TaxID=422282 RepID=A0A0G1AC59_UNCKA|nr:MAG: hypothetical protein UU72_C0001G0071 [candidate division WWE3 bacterium GW2011_GWB1_41_6]KKS19388.1 MAG: hypothetical protein UU77_C0050G0004 [candidate division WWE3 bacterium GW2011_GWC1_41_7]KKS22878.1 MAG: hypothetical protein UU80_C0001G0043 [candidate division WWE3 bacterium GW2011_GWA1_41_8]OGC57851.1 MAG: hypothetical protein A2976_01695 [candidate division WWE3 bacterium RIFCSPLOWO2_01_FULL_41_9]
MSKQNIKTHEPESNEPKSTLTGPPDNKRVSSYEKYLTKDGEYSDINKVRELLKKARKAFNKSSKQKKKWEEKC